MSFADIMDVATQPGQSPKRYAPQWITRVDRLLDIHRSRFLFREPAPAELELHKTAFELAIQTGLLINSLIENPDVSLRLRLLTDAYAIFHNPAFSEAETEALLKETFPE